VPAEKSPAARAAALPWIMTANSLDLARQPEPPERAAAPDTAIQRLDLGEVEYAQAARDMRDWVTQRQEQRAGDRLFLLSHPPVVTYGPRTSPGDLPIDATIPTVEVDRGGYATYHGPGQLVGYLVVNVRNRGAVDIVRWVENGLIEALAGLGFATIRRDTPKGASSLVGVWTPDHRKLCSIGMRIRGGVTSHGFAINIDPDMTVFHEFTACGLHDVTMTSLRELAGERGVPVPTAAQVRDAVAAALGAR
jgi:lipoate-protein ligase B